jgi:uncharacterized protein (TIGR01777 family)
MRILMIGATGTIGRRLLLHRLSCGDEVTLVSRNAFRARRLLSALGHVGVPVVEGDTAVPGPWQAAVEAQDAIIMLGGAGIADKRWSKRRKSELRSSRVDGVYQVVRAIDRAEHRPKVLISASAVGYYGDTGNALVDEFAPAGTDDLAGLCLDWENQAIRAEALCRVVRIRFGIVLDAAGGALRKMLPIFRKGLGGRLGSGRQYMSWIAWQDVLGIVDHLLDSEDAEGAYNLAAPTSVTNREFTRTLGRALGRPALLPVPGVALRLAVGGLAKHLLSGQRAYPARVLESGYAFRQSTLEGALATVLHGAASSDAEEDAPGPAVPLSMIVVDVDALEGSTLALRGALRLLDRTGCTVVFATSDGLAQATKLLHDLDRTNTVIASDGAVVLGRGGSSIHSSRTLGAALLEELLLAIRDVDGVVHVEMELLNGELCTWDSTQAPPDHATLDMVFRLHLGGDEASRVQADHLVRERFWKARQVAVHVAEDGRLQILHPMADRGIAVQGVARQLGLSRSAVGAVVQSTRSTGLAEWSGFSVALPGAAATMIQLADATTMNSGVDGLVEALERWLRPALTPAERT